MIRKLTHFSRVYESVGKSTVYKRRLPDVLIPLSSMEGRRLFKESWEEGHCEAFFPLMQQFVTQSEPSTCGLASLSMILNCLNIDPGIRWKGIWRWYDDHNIKQLPLNAVTNGVTLEQFHQIAEKNSAKSMAFICSQTSTDINKGSLSVFLSCLAACNRRGNMPLTVNFHRKSLGQTGTGHFAPIAAFHAGKQMCLVLDVAKFKYECYWCQADYLYDSLLPLDSVSGKSRGFVINKHKFLQEPMSAICSMEIDYALNKQLHKLMEQNTSTAQIINKLELHPLLVPILYQFCSNPVLFGQFQSSQAPLSGLNGETMQLLSCFSKDRPEKPMQLFSTVLKSSSQSSQSEHALVRRFITKCRNYLELTEIGT